LIYKSGDESSESQQLWKLICYVLSSLLSFSYEHPRDEPEGSTKPNFSAFFSSRSYAKRGNYIL
jgi:hypothetical protein